MGCYTGVAFAAVEQARIARREELKVPARPGDERRLRLTLLAPQIRCGQCIATIERALHELPEVASARVNPTTRRVLVTLAGQDTDPVPIATAAVDAAAGQAGSTSGEPIVRLRTWKYSPPAGSEC